MNNSKLFISFFAIAIGLVFVQCTSLDPITGPEGPAGANGTNGANGADGGNVCLSCHNTDYKVVQPETYLLSGHNLGTSNVGRTTTCTACHTHEGYTTSIPTGNILVPTTTPATNTIIGCTTCHSGGHTSAGVAVSGQDAALRHSGAYTLNQVTSTGAPVTINYGNNSNSCTHCHQPRRTETSGFVPGTSGTISVSSSFGPHYGNQSALLEGIFGHEIAGTTPYPTKGSAKHRTNASCTSCHMGAKSGNQGNHTMSPVLNNCKTCHTGAGVVDYNINAGQTKIKNLMLELGEELVRVRPANYRIANYTGTKPFTAPNVFTDPTYSTNQVTVISTINVSPSDATMMRITKAYWNWRYLYQDHSYGLHNPKYAEALMKNSIADIKLIPTP